MENEKHRRSITKSVTFRVAVIISDFAVISLITRRYDFAIGILLVTNFSSAILYYLHERIWNKIKWGRG